MTSRSDVLQEHLRQVARAYLIEVSDDRRWMKVGGFQLAPGFDRRETTLLIGIPHDYPLTPPGILPSGVYVPSDLRFRGRPLADATPQRATWLAGWSWLCYQLIRWNPNGGDTLLRFLEMLRVDLTSPRTI